MKIVIFPDISLQSEFTRQIEYSLNTLCCESGKSLRLLEYQAKELLAKNGLNTPAGFLTTRPEEATTRSESLGFPIILKAQVPFGGRGKAGAIVRVDKIQDLRENFDRLTNIEIGGAKPDSILVEEFIPHEKEIYVSVALDRGRSSYVIIAALEGGIEVENIGTKVMETIDIFPIGRNLLEAVAGKLGLEARPFEGLVNSLEILGKIVEDYDLELAEINPLIVTNSGEMLALDAKLIVDDNSLFRQQQLSDLTADPDSLSAKASSLDFSFVELEGSAAVIGNGAGLVLSTCDMLKDSGGLPACFLDLGGGAQSERVLEALKVVAQLKKASSILLNVFGGITRCTDVARGITQAFDQGFIDRPLYARISGAEEEEAREMLKGYPLKIFSTVQEAISTLVSESGLR
ncbi:MAG: ATP-grasp domain-containing protein [Nitrososphaerales archaeon]